MWGGRIGRGGQKEEEGDNNGVSEGATEAREEETGTADTETVVVFVVFVVVVMATASIEADDKGMMYRRLRVG